MEGFGIFYHHSHLNYFHCGYDSKNREGFPDFQILGWLIYSIIHYHFQPF